ncbi:hypothetical protein CXU03_08830 [Akkermansia muciniphila]|uniref:hypothetical protein n=1 Tax=Akkermansia muciniphila TaxID=239935 RepID=UPI000C9B8DFF|nr:hypothetical protein [Akkermansia muciniphila]PNC87352.1 hypothetical protein CXU03_08830 [Akkermansia muciniphila]
MNDGEIQIQFPKPGNWQEFILTAIYQDADGFTRVARYTPAEIPAEQAPAMQAVVAALVGLSEPWKAVQVWARLKEFYAPEEDDSVRTVETVDLTVEAVNPQGGRRVFTSRDYPVFVLTDPAAVEFFKHFTTNNKDND